MSSKMKGHEELSNDHVRATCLPILNLSSDLRCVSNHHSLKSLSCKPKSKITQSSLIYSPRVPGRTKESQPIWPTHLKQIITSYPVPWYSPTDCSISKRENVHLISSDLFLPVPPKTEFFFCASSTKPNPVYKGMPASNRREKMCKRRGERKLQCQYERLSSAMSE